MRTLVSILFLALVFASCGPTPIFSDKLEIESDWEYAQKLTSTIEAVDTTKRYDLALKLDHDQSFYFQNIYLEIETVFPEGEKIVEPLSLQLATKTGNWLGKCNNENCEIVFSLQDNFRFKKVGNHQFTISQFSREEALGGINEIELLLFEAQKK